MPKVSVIIPAFNRAHLLSRAIQSVINQTFQDFEIIIVDDASTDKTEDVVKSFKDNRIIYLWNNRNQGSNASRNIGLKHASGEFIAFLDSDDEWLPEKLDKQLNVFKSHNKNIGLVSTGYSNDEKPFEPVIPKYRGYILKELLIRDCIGTMSTPLIRKKCFDIVGVLDESMLASQDWDMWIKIAQFYEIDFTPDILSKYHHQPDSISKNVSAIKRAHKLIFKKYQHLLKALPKKILIERYFSEGRFFCWKRDPIESGRYFTKAIMLNPFIFFRILNHYALKVINKLLKITSFEIFAYCVLFYSLLAETTQFT